jgi:hypothetical protein
MNPHYFILYDSINVIGGSTFILSAYYKVSFSSLLGYNGRC